MSKPNAAQPTQDTGIPAGITAAAWAAMDDATKATITALAVKSQSKVKALGIKLYAEGCDKGPLVEDGDRKGQRNACFGDVGAKTCPHGKPLKGNIGITGLGQFPITMYSGQWQRFFAQVAKTVEAEADRLAAAGIGVGK